MLIFSLADLPVMSKGKGNKIINIPSAKLASGDEAMIAVAVLTKEDTLVVNSGKRHLKMKFADMEHYIGERARRGNKLPRGFQKVDGIVVEKKR